jgi:hypothetical protein
VPIMKTWISARSILVSSTISTCIPTPLELRQIR